MKFFLTLVFFFFLSQPNVAASTLDFNEAFPYAWYSNQYNPAYCVHTYEQVIDDTSYLCKAAFAWKFVKLLINVLGAKM